MTDEKIIESFLRESNAIEGVYDKRSLEDAMKAWAYLTKQKEISMSVVLMTHKILMQHQPLEAIWRGHFRRQPVWIGRHEALSPLRIQEHVVRWLYSMNEPAKQADSWKRLHVEYETIHPFVDGNGRTGRMFMNWYRLKNGERIYVVKEADRFKYYTWFNRTV